MKEPLLGGSGIAPATEEQKKEFKRLLEKAPNLTNDEWRSMQEIEWGLTKSEYIALKFPHQKDMK